MASEWAQARMTAIVDRAIARGRTDMNDTMDALDAAIEEGRREERARIVAFLRSGLDALWREINDPEQSEFGGALAQGAREALANRASRIERGEHATGEPS